VKDGKRKRAIDIGDDQMAIQQVAGKVMKAYELRVNQTIDVCQSQ
jgi:hypothetical protein